MGSSFGPAVISKIMKWNISSQHLLLSIILGFALAVLFFILPNTSGDWLERVVPFMTSLTLIYFFKKNYKHPRSYRGYWRFRDRLKAFQEYKRRRTLGLPIKRGVLRNPTMSKARLARYDLQCWRRLTVVEKRFSTRGAPRMFSLGKQKPSLGKQKPSSRKAK